MVMLVGWFSLLTTLIPGATLHELYTTTTELSNHRKEIEWLGIIIICKKVRTKYVGLLKLEVAYTDRRQQSRKPTQHIVDRACGFWLQFVHSYPYVVKSSSAFSNSP